MSQAGRKPTVHHHDLDIEDYRRDNGIRMSGRKHDIRRNRNRSAQQDRRYIEMQQRRAFPASQPSPPPSIASRATSDPGPPPTPTPSLPPPPPSRARRASKRLSEADAPNPLYSGQTKDRQLGRSAAKIRRSPTPPSAEEAHGTAEPPPADPGYPSPAELTMSHRSTLHPPNATRKCC